jgi:hypothetical protein
MSPQERARAALHTMGPSVVNGALSTLIGVLATAGSSVTLPNSRPRAIALFRLISFVCSFVCLIDPLPVSTLDLRFCFTASSHVFLTFFVIMFG